MDTTQPHEMRSPRHLLVVGGGRAARRDATETHLKTLQHDRAARIHVDVETLGWRRPLPSDLTSVPRVILIEALEQAFPNQQGQGTRFILTQSTYVLQKWIESLGAEDVIVATADRLALERAAPEAFSGRGPWRFFQIRQLPVEEPQNGETTTGGRDAERSGTVEDRLADAFRLSSADERLAICRRETAQAPDSAVAALALASASREVQDLAGARTALDVALGLAPNWEAVHYENGKFWLGCEDMARARDAFERAAELMPTFSAAFSNLGATLGELDQPEAAVAAFSRALQHDPDSFTILNNIGVAQRDLGNLDESEQALQRVTQIAPAFVFGHYNLGHTRFLRGQYGRSVEAYEEGQRRDPEKNRRQACRLAIARLASGDLSGAEQELWRAANLAPPEEREDLLLEAYEVATALVQLHPELAVHQGFLTRIAGELTV